MNPTTTQAFVGRQPIYDRDLMLYAYEILFRSGGENRATVSDSDHATAEVVLNLVSEIGLDQIVGTVPAFINVTRNFLLDRHAYALPADRVVLEVLEDVPPDRQVQDALAQLAADGYTIALDDFADEPGREALCAFAHIVKVDLPAYGPDQLPACVERLQQYPVRLLAEKVETYDLLEQCKALGFDYFQGYFFCRPKVIQASRLPANRLAPLRLLSELRSDSVALSRIAKTISTDPTLCYKLLRYVNSAESGMKRKVDSVQSAVAIVGVRRLQTLATLALMASPGTEKPPQLLVTALNRARMAELLALRLERPRPEAYFLLGLFSTLDAMLDQPLPQLLDTMPLDAEIAQALLDQSGPLVDVLRCVVAYDLSDFDQVQLESLDPADIRQDFLDALAWTRETLDSFNELMPTTPA